MAIKPGLQLIEQLAMLQRDLDRALPRRAVRWAPADQLHLTLLFLGRVPAERVLDLTVRFAVALKESRRLNLSLRDLGAFPDHSQPRVVWVGVDGDLDKLAVLQSRVAVAGAPDVERPEAREFQAHLTLGRVASRDRREIQAVARVLAETAAPRLGSWLVEEVVLVRSELRPSGSVYTDVAHFPLRAKAGN